MAVKKRRRRKFTQPTVKDPIKANGKHKRRRTRRPIK